MLRLADEQRAQFRAAVENASQRPAVHRAVRNVYVALQDAIDLRRPLCVQSGRCCRFEEFGHKLFVTTMELATFIHDLESIPPKARPSGPGLPPSGCPFQLDNLCSVHIIRPFGCRIFFCDATAADWQQAQYQRFHDELKRLHDELAVPYFYVEWREALKTVGIEASDAHNPMSFLDLHFDTPIRDLLNSPPVRTRTLHPELLNRKVRP